MRRTIPAILIAALLAGPAPAQETGLNFNVERHGEIHSVEDLRPLADMRDQPTAEELRMRAKVREYRRQIRRIRHEYLGDKRVPELRRKGIEQLREFTDPAAFLPLIEELKDEQDDVRLAVLDHFESRGEWGQAALAWTNLHIHDPELHYETLRRIEGPASEPTLSVIDAALRSEDDFVANLAGRLVGHLEIYDAIPLMIHAQSETRPVRTPGDQGWILVGRRQVFVQALIPVIGDGSGGFIPVPGVLTEGVILRVVDAVAIIYRTEIHTTLVAMTSEDWGHSTAHLGYDVEKWRDWYNQEYLPYKREQAIIERLSKDNDDGDQNAAPPGGG